MYYYFHLLALVVLCFNTGNSIAPANEAMAEYDPATGNIKVTAYKIVNWYIEHIGHDSMTGDAPIGLPVAGGLITDNDTRIGVSWPDKTSIDIDLGNVAVAGIPDDGTLVICFDSFWGPPTVCYAIAFVPEPTALLLASFASMICCCRRRCRKPT